MVGKQQIRQLRYFESELELLNRTFYSEDNLMLLRRFLVERELSEGEWLSLKSMPLDLLEVLKKTFLPKIDSIAPLGQLVDMWSSIETKNILPEQARIAMESRQIVVDYFTQKFQALENGYFGNKDIKLSELIYNRNKNDRDNLIEMAARNTILDHIEVQIVQIRTLAGEKVETPEERKTRLLKDSSK